MICLTVKYLVIYAVWRTVICCWFRILDIKQQVVDLSFLDIEWQIICRGAGHQESFPTIVALEPLQQHAEEEALQRHRCSDVQSCST